MSSSANLSKPDSQRLLLGTRKGMLILERKGDQWKFVHDSFTGHPVSHVMCDPRTGVYWTAVDHGHWGQHLHRSDDRGATWREIPAPKYPPDAMLKAMGEFRPADKAAALSYIWLIAPGGADQPNRLYIGTEPGGLFQSDDGGETFQLVESLWCHPSRAENWFGGGRDEAGLCSIIVDPRDSDHLLVGISVGGIYESTDGGKTWEGRNRGLSASYLPNPTAEFGHDPHFLVSSPAAPDVIWQQNHDAIYKSEDFAHNWQNVSEKDGPARFGFAIAVDDKDPYVAWVVPAIDSSARLAVDRAICVSRTDDGGKTWKALRKGLPQEYSYDLTFRHALALNGDRLAFGTTTGNAYFSDDRGESWQSLSHNLPPIYSVRFA